jgi:pentatricopeptide repeat protein
MINNNLKPTEVTFNTLLNKYAIDGKQNEAMSIIEMMRTWGYSPDIVTFNILLKLYKEVEDDKSVKETLLTMETFDIKKDEYSKSTLLQHFKNNLNSNEIVSIMNEENDEFMTPYIFTNAITGCDSWQHSLKLLQRAVSLNKADAAVYTAAAQSCVSQGEFDAGFRVIELMLSNGINLNKKSLSFLLSSCLSPNLDPEICSKKLKKYIDLVSDKYPNLITNEVCQKLMKGLSFRGLSSLACSFHLGPLAHTTCKSETLSILLTEMQNSCNDNDNVEFRQSLARKSLALMALYCNSNSISNRLLLRTSHFNSVLRMLSLASMHNHCEQLFRFMSGHKNITFSNIERDDHDNDDDKLILEENEVSKKLRVLWTPGTFTIAELVRAAKETTRPVLANDVIKWAVREGAFVPEGVVSDAVSFVYRVGRTDLSLSMYRSLYSVGHVQHWHDKDHLEMDLHNFSRGMAFAAIKVAIDEAKIIAKNKINRDLIIITGRSISRRSKDNNNNDEDDDLYGYKLSNEIQRVLIEDFYPPIDSATIPDNPGRLRIIIPNTD